MEALKSHLRNKILKDLENNEKIREKVDFVFENKEDFEKYIDFFYNLSEHKQRFMNSINNFVHDSKYHTRKGRILGTKSKAMPDRVYKSLIEYVREHYGLKEYLALEFEGIQGPRGEDTVRIKEDDIDFKEHIVHIHNRKRDRWYELPMNKYLEAEIKDFIEKFHKDISENKNFLFFSSNPVQKRNHLSQKYLKNVVHDSLEALKLNKVYGVASNGRKLYLYSLHSLRAHAATRAFEKNRDIRQVQQVLDHQPNSAHTTMLYLERNEEDLRDVMN